MAFKFDVVIGGLIGVWGTLGSVWIIAKRFSAALDSAIGTTLKYSSLTLVFMPLKENGGQ